MKEYDATELAYKNGVMDLSARVKQWLLIFGGEYSFREGDLDRIVKEMIGGKKDD